MRVPISVLLISLLFISVESVLGGGLPQNEEQSTSPGQQAQPTSPQGQATSSAAVQSVTGCVVQSDNGYSLKTENDSYPIETDKDLSKYVGKQVKITGILEHHTTSAQSTTNGNAGVITDLRLRLIASVIGDCNQPSK